MHRSSYGINVHILSCASAIQKMLRQTRTYFKYPSLNRKTKCKAIVIIIIIIKTGLEQYLDIVFMRLRESPLQYLQC